MVEFMNKRDWAAVLDEVLPKRKRADGGVPSQADKRSKLDTAADASSDPADSEQKGEGEGAKEEEGEAASGSYET